MVPHLDLQCEGGVTADVFERLATLAPAMLAELDDDWCIRWSNPSWRRVLGWAAEELSGQPLRAFVDPMDLADFDATVAAVRTSDPYSLARTRFCHHDGTVRWIEWYPGVSAQRVFHGRDVTARVSTDDALSQQVALMGMAEELAGVGHWSLDVESGHLHWSPQIYRIYGLPVNGPGPTLESAIAAYHPEDRERVGTLVQTAINRGTDFEFELRLLRPDGEERHVLSRGVCAVDPGTGRTRRVFGTFLDVTDRDRARDQLAREHRLATTGMLVAGVGHELNNPLTYVSANIQMVIEELEQISAASPSSQLSGLIASLEDARSGTERLKKIVRGLRLLARDASPAAATALPPVLELSANMAMHELRDRASCSVDIHDVPAVLADEARLSQVLVNLICNAAQAFPDKDPERNRVIVRCVPEPGNTVCITVSDNGPGMSEAVRVRIFEPFFTTKAVGDGTGLGLAISQSIVESFGGTLSCSTRLGVGTTFRIVLHASSAPLLPPAPRLAPVPEGKRGTVVVIDDEESVVRVTSRFLAAESDVLGFVDPHEALAHLLEVAHVDCVLCDLMMPGLSGMELYARLRAARPAIAENVVFMSGGSNHAELQSFLSTVDNERLDKPFDLSSLRALVRRMKRAR